MPVNRQERGCWLDTEGSIDPGLAGRGGADLVVTQMERQPLRDYIAGAKSDGIVCGMYRSRADGCCFVTINGLENVSRELGLVLPYVRTRRRWNQVARYRNYLARKRTRHQHQAKRALEILDAALEAMNGSSLPPRAKKLLTSLGFGHG